MPNESWYQFSLLALSTSLSHCTNGTKGMDLVSPPNTGYRRLSCGFDRFQGVRAKETDSLGACARVRCKAALWGCEIRRRHRGEISQSEKEHLAEEEKRAGYPYESLSLQKLRS
ncbi:hypothetical protein TcWFU_003393 [Taenia crassiceps]|uniref:Secreted protein n=1 Tax=Taenia crassiceps TaxID=6207 RepID=A0ABR4Q7F9_9CEST